MVSLNIPTVGSTNWGTDVNQNWQDLEDYLDGSKKIDGLHIAQP